MYKISKCQWRYDKRESKEQILFSKILPFEGAACTVTHLETFTLFFVPQYVCLPMYIKVAEVHISPNQTTATELSGGKCGTIEVETLGKNTWTYYLCVPYASQKPRKCWSKRKQKNRVSKSFFFLGFLLFISIAFSSIHIHIHPPWRALSFTLPLEREISLCACVYCTMTSEPKVFPDNIVFRCLADFFYARLSRYVCVTNNWICKHIQYCTTGSV